MKLSCSLLTKCVFGRIVCLDFVAGWEKISRVDPQGFLFFVCPKKTLINHLEIFKHDDNKPSGIKKKITIMTISFGVISFEVGM